jgi:hypothetical protein
MLIDHENNLLHGRNNNLPDKSLRKIKMYNEDKIENLCYYNKK